MTSLERDRQDLQLTIDALQEGMHAYMFFFMDFYCLFIFYLNNFSSNFNIQFILSEG